MNDGTQKGLILVCRCCREKGLCICDDFFIVPVSFTNHLKQRLLNIKAVCVIALNYIRFLWQRTQKSVSGLKLNIATLERQTGDTEVEHQSILHQHHTGNNAELPQNLSVLLLECFVDMVPCYTLIHKGAGNLTVEYISYRISDLSTTHLCF